MSTHPTEYFYIAIVYVVCAMHAPEEILGARVYIVLFLLSKLNYFCYHNYRLVVISVKLLLLSLHQRTPLCLSARKDSIEILKYLSDKGADVNIKDDGGVSE